MSITGPWMHNGGFDNLEDVVKHHLNPEFHYAIMIYRLPPSLKASYKGDSAVINRILASLYPLVTTSPGLSQSEVQDLIAFLGALTDSSAMDINAIIPKTVPGGLPVEDVQLTTKPGRRKYGY